MLASVNLYSETSSELNRFLSNFYNSTFDLNNKLNWKKEYANPIELAEIIGAFVDNCEKYHLNMWICCIIYFLCYFFKFPSHINNLYMI